MHRRRQNRRAGPRLTFSQKEHALSLHEILWADPRLTDKHRQALFSLLRIPGPMVRHTATAGEPSGYQLGREVFDSIQVADLKTPEIEVNPCD